MLLAGIPHSPVPKFAETPHSPVNQQTDHFSHFFAFSNCRSRRCGLVFFSLRFISTAYTSHSSPFSTISIRSLYDKLNCFSDLRVTSLYSACFLSSYSSLFRMVISRLEIICVSLSSLLDTNSRQGCFGTSSLPCLPVSPTRLAYSPNVGSR